MKSKNPWLSLNTDNGYYIFIFIEVVNIIFSVEVFFTVSFEISTGNVCILIHGCGYAVKVLSDKPIIPKDLRLFICVKSDGRGYTSRFFRFQRCVSSTHDRL